MFSEEQRDILRETLEWTRYNAGQEVDESYDFTNAPKLDQGGWFDFPPDDDGSHWSRLYKVAQIDVRLLLGGVPRGTTACVAGYIVYSTRVLRWDQSLPGGEEIAEYAARVLSMPNHVAYWLFDTRRSPAKIIDYLKEVLEDNRW